MSELVIRSATPGDWPRIVELATACFGSGGDEWYMRTVWPHMPEAPDWEWDRVRVGLVDGQIVGSLIIVDRVLHFERAALRFGGIDALCAHPDHRRRGHAAALMRDALGIMAAERFALTLLYAGVARYYDRFGYVNVFPSSLLFVTLEEVRRIALADDYLVRPYVPEDTPALLALYETEWGSRPWFRARTLDWLRWRLDRRRKDGQPYTFVAEDRSGQVRGYSCGWDPAQRQEVVVADREAAAALLRHAEGEIAGPPERTVRWVEPPDTRAGRSLRELCTVQNQVWTTQRGGWMGSLVDVEAALDALRPEIAARLARLGVAGADAVTLERAADGVRLAVGSVQATISEAAFIQLLFGYWWPADLDDLPDLSEAARELLARLFPHQTQQFAGLDWF